MSKRPWRSAPTASISVSRTRESNGRSRGLSELGEFGFLAELERRGLAQGIEHDAAQFDDLVVTQDALVEQVHFRLDWTTWRELGFKAAAANLSDLAACGAEPRGLI